MKTSTKHLGTPQHFFTIHPEATALDAQDVSDALLNQAHASITVLISTFDDVEKDFNISPLYLHAALWSIQNQLELLENAMKHKPKTME